MSISKRLFLGFFILALLSCKKEKVDYGIYSKYKPVLMDNGVINICTYTLPQPNKLISQIRTMENYILALDYGLGIHVIDNQNPNEPIKLGFYKIPACIDFEIKNKKVYANNYRDFIVLDFSNISSPVELKREKNAFDIVVKSPDGGTVYPQLTKLPVNTTIISYER